MAGPLRLLDHAQGDAVLDAAAGVQLLELDQDGRAHAAGQGPEANQGRVAHQVEDALRVLHGRDSRRLAGSHPGNVVATTSPRASL